MSDIEKNKEEKNNTTSVQLLDNEQENLNKANIVDETSVTKEDKSKNINQDSNITSNEVNMPLSETADKQNRKSIDNKMVKKQENSPAVISNNNKIAENHQAHKSTNILAIFGILLLGLILIIIIAFFIFSYSMSKSINIYSGVYIKNIDVSNLDKQTASNTVNTYISNHLPEEITLIHGEYEATLNTEELNIQFNVDDAVNAAYDIGRSKNIFMDGINILSTMINNKNVEPTFSIDNEILSNMLKDISSKLPDKVIESGYYIEDNNLIINKGADGVVIDIDKTMKSVKENIKNLNVLNNKIEIITTDASPTELDIEKIYKEIHKDAVNAQFISDPMTVVPSEEGIDFSISLDEAKEKLAESEQECVIPLKIVYPEVTVNMLGAEAFPDELSEFSTRYSTSDYNRTTNLILAANKINGTVLMPGEVFSYNQVVGERTIAAGYKEAPIYVSGRVEDGLGGGICQITTTLYNAVVYANLEIVERTNHQFVPSYVGAGRDATVVYGAIDFKFKNNRDYPIKINCSVGGGIAKFEIFGLKKDDDYSVEVFSRITSQTANSTNSETYKILKQNGEVVNQVLLSRDTYKRH